MGCGWSQKVSVETEDNPSQRGNDSEATENQEDVVVLSSVAEGAVADASVAEGDAGRAKGWDASLYNNVSRPESPLVPICLAHTVDTLNLCVPVSSPASGVFFTPLCSFLLFPVPPPYI